MVVVTVAAVAIAVRGAGLGQHDPLVVGIKREVMGVFGVELEVLQIHARHSHLGVHPLTVTRGRELTLVEGGTGPAGGDIHCVEHHAVVAVQVGLVHLPELIHLHIGVGLGQLVVLVAEAEVETVVLVDRETAGEAEAYGGVFVVDDVGIGRAELVVVEAAAQADAIDGEVGIVVAEIDVLRVVVGAGVDADLLAGPHEVVLLQARLQAQTRLGTVADAGVDGTCRLLLDLEVQIDLIVAARHPLGVHFRGLEEAEAVETGLGLLDVVGGEPGAFHLTHLATQHFVLGGDVAAEVDVAHIDPGARLYVDDQLHFLGLVIDLGEGDHFGVGVAITAEELGEHLFGVGHLAGGVDAARLYGDEPLHIAATVDEIALELHAGDLVLIPFLDVQGDVDALLVRGHGDLGGLLSETYVAAVHVVGAQHFDVTGQLLLLIALIAGEVPPGHIVLQGELGQQFLFREHLVADYVDLLDLGRFPFHEGELEVDPVAGQRGDDGLDLGGVLAHAVVEIFQSLLEGAQHGAIQGITDADAGGLQALGQLLLLDVLVAGKLDAGDGRAFLHHDLQHLAVTIDLDVLEVAGGIELLDGVGQGHRVHGVTDPDRQIQQGGAQGHPLQTLDLNVLHHKRGRGRLSQEAGSQQATQHQCFFNSHFVLMCPC